MAQFSKKRYNTLEFEGAWRDSFGCPEQGSHWLIYGSSGHGKTDFTVKLSKYLSTFGRVLYVSAEEGDKNTIHTAFVRNDVLSSDIHLGVGYTIADVLAKCRSTKIKAIVLDSLDYLQITQDDYRKITKTNKIIVSTAWAEGKKPAKTVTQAVEYMCDVKIRVLHFMAHVRCRYGGNKPYVIWDDGAAQHYHFLNQ